MRTWHPEEGWGSIKVEGLGEECFVRFSCIVQRGNEFLELVPGEHVMLTWHTWHYAQQDGFAAVADRIERY